MNAPPQACRRRDAASIAVCLFGLLTGLDLHAQTDCGYPLYEGPAYADLMTNGVNARFNVGNVHFYQGVGSPHFEAPAGSGQQGIFAANLLIAGEMGGEVRAVVANYSPTDVKPGPLDEQGVPSNDCERYRHVYKVAQRDILEYERTGATTPDLRDWPWQGGAPVVDGDGIEGNYDLLAGDRPAIEGHEMLWYVVNDAFDGPREGDSSPLGLELQVLPFAASNDEPALEYAVLVRYRLTNRGIGLLTSAYFGIHSANNVGRVGSDTTLGLAFGYGTDEVDVSETIVRRGAIGYTILQGFPASDDGFDNDDDQSVDEPGEETDMAHFVVWQSSSGENGNPQSKEDYYNYLRGFWRDGEPITYGGSGRDFSTTPVDFMYPGEPGEFWSEENPDKTGNAHSPAYEFMWSTGPFSLDVNESKDLVIGIVWAEGEDRFDSVRKLKETVPKLRGYWDTGFEIPLPEPPSTEPALYAPDDRVGGQPTNLRLSWRKQPDHERHELQVSRSPEFASLVDSAFTSETTLELNVAADADYYWRVRGVNAAGYGPWSETWSFSTGSVVQIGPGALDVDGSKTWAFIQVAGGEGEHDACRPLAESRWGCDEVGGNLVYGSFNGARTWTMYSGYGIRPESAVGRFAPHDFELRFTPEGSYAYHATTSGRLVQVPFETWDVGNVGPFGTNDPADDVRLIPGLYSDNGGECFFGFGEIPDDPFGLGWPVSDRIQAYYPAPGVTYDDWRRRVKPLVDDTPDGCPISSENDSVSLLVDVARMPLQNIVFMMDPASENYRLEGIPTGNVIRFLTTKPTAPILSAPADDAEFHVGGLLNRLSLWWQLPPGVTESRVRLTRSVESASDVLVDTVVSGTMLELRSLPVGQYHWQVGYAIDSEFWSEPSMFSVLSILSAEDELAEFPTVLTLRRPYPNPASSLAHFDVGLPSADRVTLTAFDLLGRRVGTIADAPMTEGWRTIHWNTTSVSNGVYVVHLQAGKTAATAKVVVVK